MTRQKQKTTAAATTTAVVVVAAKTKANNYEIKLSADKKALLDYHELVPDHQVTPSISEKGFTHPQIRNLLKDDSQKYCIDLHYKDLIHFFHSIFLVGDEVFVCTAKYSVNGDAYVYVKFHISESGPVWWWDSRIGILSHD